MVEMGWYCFGGTPLTRSICKLRPQPSIIGMSIIDTDTPATKMVTLTFNETVLLNKNWVASDLAVEIIGPKTPYVVESTLMNSETSKTAATDKM
jgi:hypothetical protein